MSVRELPAPMYQWMLDDDGQVHAVSDDEVMSSALAEDAKAWVAICGQEIAPHMGPPDETATVCWSCERAIPANAVEAPWPGGTL